MDLTTFKNKIFIPGLILVVLDFIYISAISFPLFEKQIIGIQKTTMEPKTAGVISSYILMILGLYYFIIRNHLPVKDAFLLGIFVNGVYETTSYSLFKKWKFQTVVIDTLWGGILYALTTFITYKLYG
jgi:uncharacterized membrane protein